MSSRELPKDLDAALAAIFRLEHKLQEREFELADLQTRLKTAEAVETITVREMREHGHEKGFLENKAAKLAGQIARLMLEDGFVLCDYLPGNEEDQPEVRYLRARVTTLRPKGDGWL